MEDRTPVLGDQSIWAGEVLVKGSNISNLPGNRDAFAFLFWVTLPVRGSVVSRAIYGTMAHKHTPVR
jgi:hypothetical protein